MTDSYNFPTGLLDDYDAEILDAWFGTDARYNNGQTLLLFFKMQTDQPDAGAEHDGIVEERWSCGGDWETNDGGKTAEHVKTGQERGFHANSQAAKLITRALELGAPLRDRGNSYDSSIWVGLTFHFNREKSEYTDPQTKEKKTAERLMPTAFTDGAAIAAPVEKADEKAQEVLGSLDPALVEALRALKAEVGTHSAFVDKAMELTEVAGNTTLVMALATPDGLWKEL